MTINETSNTATIGVYNVIESNVATSNIATAIQADGKPAQPPYVLPEYAKTHKKLLKSSIPTLRQAVLAGLYALHDTPRFNVVFAPSEIIMPSFLQWDGVDKTALREAIAQLKPSLIPQPRVLFLMSPSAYLSDVPAVDSLFMPLKNAFPTATHQTQLKGNIAASSKSLNVPPPPPPQYAPRFNEITIMNITRNLAGLPSRSFAPSSLRFANAPLDSDVVLIDMIDQDFEDLHNAKALSKTSQKPTHMHQSINSPDLLLDISDAESFVSMLASDSCVASTKSVECVASANFVEHESFVPSAGSVVYKFAIPPNFISIPNVDGLPCPILFPATVRDGFGDSFLTFLKHQLNTH
ncbi:UNVERIFIED_CONTAM: hypothetical protein HDU68_004150 [Siphonaria sp. JEL0065]|nr:hypothetical protein HDU68_004150 [Siphonaria sp. JEL0065]